VNRKAFGNAASEGLSVVEYRPEDPKAIEEMMTLYKLAFNSEK
jgi:chromosome partitioning protein